MVEPDELGCGDDEDVAEITPAIPVPPAVPRPPTQRRGGVGGGGSFGCGPRGCAVAKLPSGELPTVQTPNNVGIKMGHVPGAVDWLADCVLNYGTDKVYVVSFVQRRRLRELLAEFLHAQDGLL